ncbi:MAG: protease inhibitor I42 family protein [Acutalibacteraceae bacterium]
MKILSRIIAFFMSIIMTLFPSLFPKNNLDMDYVAEGKSLVINLDSNPTTGYSWSVEISDESVICLVKSEYTQTSSGMGAGGRDSFRFVGLSEGESQINFAYCQQWTEDPAVNTAQFNVSVDKNGNVTVESYEIK